MKFHLPLLLVLATSLSAVPSDINYQGRLSDANGDAVTGDVSMSVKMYDAQSGGNEIYSEDIGTVTLDENGVYSFQFGASGNSTVTKTETIVTSDGTSTEYTGTFTSTPIDGTISVTDETYSWNDVDGNPGEQATAYIIIINGFVIYADIENGGSGYDDDNPPLVTITGDGSGATATATVENGAITGIVIDDTGNNYTEGDIAIAPPPAPFTVDKVDGNLEVGYFSSPTNGTGVVATYKALEPSIIGALSEASSHWLELTVDGTAQNPRERILSVPFAQVARTSLNSNDSAMNYNYAFTTDSVVVGPDEYIEVNQLFNSDRSNANSNLYLKVNGYYSISAPELKYPISIGGPCTVQAYQRSIGIPAMSYRIKKKISSNSSASDSGSRNTEDPYSNSLFSIIEGSFSWDQALADAESRGGRLAVLNTFQKSEEVRQLLESQGSWPNLWIGAGDVEQEGDWKWINGDNLNNGFTNWHTGEPSNTQEEDYLVLYSNLNNGLWNDEGTAGRYGYILESIAPLENSLFEIIEGNYTWHEAKLDAESKGGKLAVLNTQDKINSAKAFIIDMTTDNYIPKVWIGCTDEESEGEWLWIDGTSVTLNDWRPGQPDNHGGGNQHYASFTDNAVWDDAQLNWVWSNGYLLEMD